MIVNFNEISLHSQKSGTCPMCRTPARRSKKFYQTLNPFNKNKNGFIKTREEILKELKEEINQWHKEPVYHAKCE